MTSCSRSHVTDQILLRNLAACVSRENTNSAELLADLAEVDARRLYLPAAHPSMFSYCVHALHLSEDSAFKRIRAARTARDFPGVFTAVAEGRLHLSAVVLLAAYLTHQNAVELLAAAAHKTKAQIEQLLAERFPRPELPTRVEASQHRPHRRRSSSNWPRGQLRRLPSHTLQGVMGANWPRGQLRHRLRDPR